MLAPTEPQLTDLGPRMALQFHGSPGTSGYWFSLGMHEQSELPWTALPGLITMLFGLP